MGGASISRHHRHISSLNFPRAELDDLVASSSDEMRTAEISVDKAGELEILIYSSNKTFHMFPDMSSLHKEVGQAFIVYRLDIGLKRI